jgi:hypothetical protein
MNPAKIEFEGPRLLVSVRNASEAAAALAGGCDVLDLKEPGRGALGMLDTAMIDAVLEQVSGSPALPVSLALGECSEWESSRRIPRLPDGIDYLKLGTAGLKSDAGWGARFAAVKRRVETDAFPVNGAGGTAKGGERRCRAWIAVGYADWQLAAGPGPEEVMEGATACGCTGVLIDTFSKGNKRLTDWLNVDRLDSLASLARSQGLVFAIAGSLRIGDLASLRTVGSSIVGIRSAACRAGIRTAEIDPAAVRAFRKALAEIYSGDDSDNKKPEVLSTEY